jgi:type II secretory pathway pseudopilin PulG
MAHDHAGSMTASHSARKQRGFSIVEIAVVLVITGLALGAGLALLNARLAQAKVDATKTRVETIRQAMTAFVSQNYRLPCPAAPGLTKGVANYNIERVTGASGSQICTAASGLTNNIGGTAPLGVSRGTVPCVTLGLSEDTCTDGWGSRFTYFVQNSAIRMTVNNASGMQGTMTVHKITPPAAATTTLGLSPTGNQINACSTTAGDNSCNLAAVAMVISHGANRGGGFMPVSATAVPTGGSAISAYELENTDNNIRFIQNDYIEQGVNAFDDVVLTIAPRDVVFSLSQMGVVKLPAAFMAERFDLVKQALLQTAYANALPATTPRTLQLPAESGAAAAYAFLAANFPGCMLPTTTQVLPLAAVVPALGAGGGILNDAWGNPIRYRRVTNSVAQGDACSVPLLLLSYGPDGVPSADDLVYYITKQDVNAFISKYGGW